MAETVKVEIPISAKDSTGSGVSSAQRRLTSLDRSLQKTQQKIDKMTRGHHKVDLDAHDAASEKISSVDAALAKTEGKGAVVDVEANDAATGVLNSVGDAAAELNGDTAAVDLEAEDAASGVISDVSDGVSELNGETATVDLEAEDNASGVISSVDDRAESLNGKVVNVLIQAEDTATSSINSLANRATVPIAGAAGMMGASFGVYDSVSTFAGFEQAMSQVQAISGATGSDLDALTEKAKYMGATTKFTATESASAFNYMAMAGWKTNDMLNGIEGVMNLAAASGEDLATTSDIVTDALTAFGMKASDSTHFADVMAQASANANTNVSMMGESFKYVAPVAGAMKYSIEDTALALGLMANAGVKSSMSGTALRRAITSLANPTDKAAAAFEQYGIDITNADGTTRSLKEVMTDLRTGLGGLSDAEKTAAVSTMFGNQALAGMLAIINSSEEDWDKLSTAINNSEGAAKNMADTMLDNLQGSFTLMQSAIEGVKDEFGGRLAPYFRSLADGITASMPGATEALNSFMDKVDVKMAHAKKAWGSMISTDEWKNSGIGGKINMFFDTMVGAPISKWARQKGGHMISSAIGGMFMDATKILPGGEKAGLTSWLSAGVFAKGASVAVKGVQGLSTALMDIAPKAAMAVPWVAAVAAGITGLAIAVDYYNQKQAKMSLSEHFGDITLTAAQAAAVASQILDAQWAVNIDLALGELRNADQLHADAQAALQRNDALEYKSSVGITLTPEETEDYKTNIETFIKSELDALSSVTHSADIMVKTMLKTPEGESLATAIGEWALEDNIEMTNLSEQLRTAVDNALSDGLISVDEQMHINELQNKINSIMAGWKQAEADASMDLIAQKYGSLSGKELTGESFKMVVEELTAQRQENSAALDEASKGFYEMVNAWDNSGRLAERGLDANVLKEQWVQAVRNAEAQSLMNSVGFERNTLMDTYGKEINDWKLSSAADRNANVDNTMQWYSEGALADGAKAMDFFTTMNNGFFDAGAEAGLKDVWAAMLPDATAMGEMIDQFRETMQPVPKELMNAFNETMQMGAAAGDAEAGWHAYAMALKNSGADALIEDIQNGTVIAPEELKLALDRIMQEVTDEPITIEGLQAEVEGVEITGESTSLVEQKIGDFLHDGLEFMKSNVKKVTSPQVEVEPGEVSADSAADNVWNETDEAIDAEMEEGFEADAETNVTLSQTNNASAIWAQTSSDIISRYSSGFSVSAPVAVTLNWHITNPTANIDLGGRGSARVTATVHSAEGRFVDSPMLSLIGEDGPEFVIPVGAKRHARGMDLWMQAGAALGVPGFADGGVVGLDENGLLANPFTKGKNSPLSVFGALPAAAGASQKEGNGSTNGVQVNVNMSPVVQINGDSLDEEEVFEVMKSRMKEVADDIGYEVGEKLAKIFGNMPLVEV